MKKQNICSINSECPTRPCPNYFSCKDLAISWEIPYYRDSEGLFVKKWGWRRDWTAQSKSFDQPMDQCPINGSECGYYKPVYDPSFYSEDDLDNGVYYYSHKNLMNERMIESWEEAGFFAAEDIKSKPAQATHFTEADIDAIPF